MHRELLKEKFRGALLGAAVGDALSGSLRRVSLINESALTEPESNLGALQYDDTAKMAEVVRHTAAITHAHELGVEGAMLQAFAISRLVQQPPNGCGRVALGELLTSHAPDAWPDIYVHKLKEVKELLHDQPAADVKARIGNGVEAHQSVPAAVYCFLSHSASFSEAVRYAIRVGGDNGAIVAMTGALAGAYLGQSAIPWSCRGL